MLAFVLIAGLVHTAAPRPGTPLSPRPRYRSADGDLSTDSTKRLSRLSVVPRGGGAGKRDRVAAPHTLARGGERDNFFGDFVNREALEAEAPLVKPEVVKQEPPPVKEPEPPAPPPPDRTARRNEYDAYDGGGGGIRLGSLGIGLFGVAAALAGLVARFAPPLNPAAVEKRYADCVAELEQRLHRLSCDRQLLADEFATSRRSLERQVKAATTAADDLRSESTAALEAARRDAADARRAGAEAAREKAEAEAESVKLRGEHARMERDLDGEKKRRFEDADLLRALRAELGAARLDATRQRESRASADRASADRASAERRAADERRVPDERRVDLRPRLHEATADAARPARPVRRRPTTEPAAPARRPADLFGARPLTATKQPRPAPADGRRIARLRQELDRLTDDDRDAEYSD